MPAAMLFYKHRIANALQILKFESALDLNIRTKDTLHFRYDVFLIICPERASFTQ